MIPELGLFALILAFCTALTVVILPLIGWKYPHYAYFLNVIRPGVLSQCFFVLLSFITLVYCFLTNDFTVQYVAHNSYTQLPWFYKICGVWGAHEGSLLLWALILSLWTVAVMLWGKKTDNNIFDSLVLVVLSALNVGFLWLLLESANPFLRFLPFSPTEGADLNPLLQDVGFILHPPILYMGYVGLAVPFAYAIAFITASDAKLPWAHLARPWSLLAWGFLTIGIALGSWWAYYELGWGGWWFWDPVENASFMPWLLGAALVHALYISSLRHTFIAWSVGLAVCSFILSLMGTFLVRSGILSSVHSFASDPKRGLMILFFLGTVAIFSVGLYATRMHRINHTQKNITPITTLSRESILLFGNMLLVVATITVLLGTLYPLILDMLALGKISVGAPYFNIIFAPLMIPLLIAMTFAPYLQWGSDSGAALWQRIKKLRLPIFFVGLIGGWLIAHQIPIWSIIAILLSAIVIASTLLKLFTNWPIAWPRWGMILAHSGLAISILGIALTSALETEKSAKLQVGESVKLGTYTFLFNALDDKQGSNYIAKKGNFLVMEGDKALTSLTPEKRYFTARETVMTETGISPGFLRDFYITLGEPFEDGSWSLKIYIKPFVRWIWLGALLIASGAWISAIALLRSAK